MKLKKIKKKIKKYLFDQSMSQNFFMIFEIDHVTNNKFNTKFESTIYFSKQISNKSLSLFSKNFKYPTKIKSVSFLRDILNYISYLKTADLISSVFFVKFFFFFLKKNKFILNYFF